MTLTLDKSNSKEVAKQLIEKKNQGKKSGNLSQHFGKLKRNLDGLQYQLAMRIKEN